MKMRIMKFLEIQSSYKFLVLNPWKIVALEKTQRLEVVMITIVLTEWAFMARLTNMPTYNMAMAMI